MANWDLESLGASTLFGGDEPEDNNGAAAGGQRGGKGPAHGGPRLGAGRPAGGVRGKGNGEGGGIENVNPNKGKGKGQSKGKGRGKGKDVIGQGLESISAAGALVATQGIQEIEIDVSSMTCGVCSAEDISEVREWL